MTGQKRNKKLMQKDAKPHPKKELKAPSTKLIELTKPRVEDEQEWVLSIHT